MNHEATDKTDIIDQLIFIINQAAVPDKAEIIRQIAEWSQQQVDSRNHSRDLVTTPIVRLQSTSDHTVVSLIQNDTHFRYIAENIDQVFWIMDMRKKRFLYINPAFENVWGYSTERLYNNPALLIDSVHPEDRIQFIVSNQNPHHKPTDQVYRIIRPDGNLRWVYVKTIFTKDSQGTLDYQICVAQDNTDLKEVELTLRRTVDRTREQFDLSRKMSLSRKPEAVLRTLMSAHDLRPATHAAFLFFDDPRIGPASGLETIANWKTDPGQPIWENEQNLYEDSTFWDLLQSNRTVIIKSILSDNRISSQVREHLLEGRFGSLVIFPLVARGDWLGCLVVYFMGEQNFNHLTLRHLKVLIDQATITLYNLKLLKIEEEARHEAERANEIKTQFLAMISHELRTPLSSIIGFSTTLLASDVSWEPEEQNDFLTTIQQEGYRLQELIDHLLDLSQLEAGMMPISKEHHTVAEILEDARPQLSTLVRSHIFTLAIPPNLQPVYVDKKRISQVIVNLVRNAAAYTPVGSEISITANSRAGFIQMSVSDQGPGIPPADTQRVFQAFRRGNNTLNNFPTQGAGLGLAICKGLIEAHGGHIWIKRQNSPGATFSFTLPIYRPGGTV